jgi:hypothetical protein
MSTHESKLSSDEREEQAQSGQRPALRYQLAPSGEAPDLDRTGFSGSCENASLADWIQLVQMGRRDAIVRVRDHDGKEGLLWCRDGDVIDAMCDGLTGEDAVHRALAWEGGQVSVSFGSFERPRRIQVGTAGLLLRAAYKRDSGVRELRHPQRTGINPLPPRGMPGAPLSIGMTQIRPPASATTREPAVPMTPALPAATVYPGLPRRSSPPPPRDEFEAAGNSVTLRGRRSLSPRLVFAVLILTALVVGLMVTRAATRSATSAAAGTPSREFAVSVAVEPAHARIQLDGKVVAVGQLDKTLPNDGRTHEIEVSAPGYVSVRRVVRDTSLHERIALKPSRPPEEKSAVVDPKPVSAAAPAPRIVAPPREARRPPVSVAVKPAAGAVNDSSRSAASDRVAKATIAKPNVQVIEERSARIQIIDDRDSKIEVIE